MPSLTTPARRAAPGYDNEYPGGYSERMLVDPGGLVPIPNGFDPALAALTEPMAVGRHAVGKGDVTRNDTALVLGCGPVGLAVIFIFVPALARDLLRPPRANGAVTDLSGLLETALATIRRERPQVVLLDLGLPEISGYEVAKTIRKHEWSRSVYISALTGWGQEEDRRRTKEAGFDHHLVKPVDLPAIDIHLQHARG